MKSLTEQLKENKGKIVWLASYPKSGNTWFRCLLSGLIKGRVDINKINTDGIFSNRNLFDAVCDIDGRLLDEEESKLRMPEVFRAHIKQSSKLEFTKVHDAYSYDKFGQPIFPSDVTHKVVYLVRNPLDVVGSFANHNATTIDVTIEIMNNKNGYLVRQANGLNNMNQLPQLMYDWSGHVNSWTQQKNIDVEIVRYEDMKKAPVRTFSRVIKSLGLKVNQKRISQAVQIAKFDNLKKMEEKKGFREKNPKSPSFFRKGKSGSWKTELTKQQIQEIKRAHQIVMKRLDYL